MIVDLTVVDARPCARNRHGRLPDVPAAYRFRLATNLPMMWPVVISAVPLKTIVPVAPAKRREAVHQRGRREEPVEGGNGIRHSPTARPLLGSREVMARHA